METPKEQFVRNHDESLRIMRARQREEEERGDFEHAAEIEAIADEWEGIGEQAKETP